MRVFHHAALARARLELGLTQDQAAEAVGIDVRTYRRYESGAVNQPGRGFAVRGAARRQLIARFASELGVDEAELIREPAPAAWAPLFVHALPRPRCLVGRDAVVARVAAFASGAPCDGRVLVLVGAGGFGKTAVVERALASLSLAGGVLVYSFYDDPRVGSFLEHAARYFSRGEEAPPGERLDRLVAALRGGVPHVVVLDGFETVQADGRGERPRGSIPDASLRRLLRAIASGLGGARALITSRLPLVDLESGVVEERLAPLSRDESIEVMRAWGWTGSTPALSRAAAEAGGHPLSVAMFGSYGAAFGSRAVGRLSAREAGRDDVLAFRLSRVLAAHEAALSEEERELLGLLAIFPNGVDLALLARVSGVRSVDRVLARVVKLGLVSFDPSSRRATTHPFVRDHLKGGPDLHERVRATLIDAPGLFSGTGLDRMEALALHTLGAGHAAAAYEVYARGLGGFRHLGLELGEMDRGRRLLSAFATDGTPSSIALDGRLGAALAYDWGLYAAALGDLELAIACYERHLAGAELASERATALRTLGYTLRLAGALEAAHERLEESLAVARAADELEHVVRALALLGAVLSERGEAEAAEERFAAARALDPRGVGRRPLWQAEHSLARGRVEEARALARANLERCAALGWAGHVSHSEAVLGHAALAAGDVDAAASHLSRASPWPARSGEVEAVLRVKDLAARVALARGEPASAEAIAQDALDLARATGFGLAASRLARL